MSKPVKYESALVAGADLALRRLTSTILRQQGFVVSEASTIADVRRAFKSSGGSFSLLVASYDLPDSGEILETVLRLRVQSEDLKIVLTSGFSPEPSNLELMRSAGIAFLSLPYSFARFSHTISLLRKRPAPGPAPAEFTFEELVSPGIESAFGA